MDADPPTVAPMTLDVLARALESEGPTPLKSTARKPGLLPGGPDTKSKKDTRRECLDPSRGLFEVSGTAADPLLRITREGIEVLFAARTPGERNVLLGKVANPLKEMAYEVAAKMAESELKGVTGRQAELTRQAGELQAQLTGMLKDRLAGVQRLLIDLNAQATELRRLVGETDGADPKPRRDGEPGGPPRRPVTDGDIDFQRDLCREIALQWEAISDPTAREALELAMFNAGLDRTNEVGDTVAFDAGQHQAKDDADLQPGQPARVVDPGWQYTSSRGVLRIVRPRVSPVTDREGRAHAPHAQH